jgi:hypothetical protein
LIGTKDDAQETACFDASTRETASVFATYAYTTLMQLLLLLLGKLVL